MRTGQPYTADTISATSTSSGRPAATTRPWWRRTVDRVSGCEVQVVGGRSTARPRAASSRRISQISISCATSSARWARRGPAPRAPGPAPRPAASADARPPTGLRTAARPAHRSGIVRARFERRRDPRRLAAASGRGADNGHIATSSPTETGRPVPRAGAARRSAGALHGLHRAAAEPSYSAVPRSVSMAPRRSLRSVDLPRRWAQDRHHLSGPASSSAPARASPAEPG